MKRRTKPKRARAVQDRFEEKVHDKHPPDVGPEQGESTVEFDDSSDLDEPEASNGDDDRWDVFLLDDDGDPLPDYGDFWLPD